MKEEEEDTALAQPEVDDDLVPTDVGVVMADEYERRYMADGALAHVEKRAAPRWMQVLVAFAVLPGAALLFTPQWLVGLAMLPIGVMMWLFLSMLRLTVTDRSVHVQYGPFGPKIPMSAIESSEALRYKWTTYGGWGIRYAGRGEWMYNMPGDGGNAVRIVWRDAKGRQRITNVGTPNAARVAQAIVRTRRALSSARATPALPAGEKKDPG